VESSRHSTLEELIELRQPLAAVCSRLAEYPWDSEEELVTLLPEHVVGVLARFAASEISAEEVESWANAIECREDVALANEHVAQAVFQLANPLITEPIALASAARLVAALGWPAT
jgi:hypothetical protein